MREVRRVRSSDDRHINRPGANQNKRLPFCGVDGEGGGFDDLGRQRYLLLRAGEFLQFEGNRDLTTDDCLGFIAGLPHDRLYIAYYFDYDVTMILRHVSQKVRERILRPVFFGIAGERRATYVGDYEVEYMPRKYFKVKHVRQKDWVQINDVGSFFQCSFVKAITDWECGTPEQRAMIAANKALRAGFDDMTDNEIEYNKIECQMLEELMTKFRTVCTDTGYIPARWQGPGYLASAMMKQHGIPKRKEFGLDPELLDFTNAAYYGGRFELFKIGSVKNVHENDINSAYPYAMLTLPCLSHGTWYKGSGRPPDGSLYAAKISFNHPTALTICHFPIRDTKSGSIYWPIRGNGIYWSCEIDAAIATGTCDVEYQEHWVYEKQCDCHPFDFVTDVFNKRKTLGKATKGYALKLAINSLYGKTAQSIGSAPYANPIWAGIITATTRAMLIRAYAPIDSRNVVMLATDGIYTTEPLPLLPSGGLLGEWEGKLHDEMFLIQPGIYFSSASKDRPKTRGAPMATVLRYEQQFRDTFATWAKNPPELMHFYAMTGRYPYVELDLHVFIGLKLAQAWNKPDEAGKWKDVVRKISFDFSTKRDWAIYEDGHISTFPRPGGADIVSEPYSKTIGAWREDVQIMSAMMNDQPDLFPIAPQQQEYDDGSDA